MAEITENGITYIVTGDYPDGRYVKHIKEKGSAKKSVYSPAQFVSMIPKAKIREIQTAASTNDDINMWVFNIQLSDIIDMNDLPTWFTNGIEAIVAEGIITQAQVTAFLEL